MAWVVHQLWVRHNLRPGVFWSLPIREQLFLAASLEVELEELNEIAKRQHRGR